MRDRTSRNAEDPSIATGFSFERVDAADYDDLRPGYAPAAVACALQRGGLTGTSLVADVAAGTGQLSRILVERVRCVAVEPATNMRELLQRRVPGVDVVAARAESLPFRDGALDGVFVGNAFHHFDAGRAFTELRRVLRRGGVLALFWARAAANAFDDPVVKRINDETARRRERSPIGNAYRSWYAVPGTVDGFTPFERRRFPTSHVIPSNRYVDLYRTSSDIVAMPEHEREELLDIVSRLAKDLPETLHLPAETEVDVCVRR